MIKIVICDDNELDRKAILDACDGFFEKPGQYQTITFESGADYIRCNVRVIFYCWM